MAIEKDIAAMKGEIERLKAEVARLKAQLEKQAERVLVSDPRNDEGD